MYLIIKWEKSTIVELTNVKQEKVYHSCLIFNKSPLDNFFKAVSLLNEAAKKKAKCSISSISINWLIFTALLYKMHLLLFVLWLSWRVKALCLSPLPLQMPSFDLMDKVELFVRTGTFPVGASKSSKKVTRAASKHFVYKGIKELRWQVTRCRAVKASLLYVKARRPPQLSLRSSCSRKCSSSAGKDTPKLPAW